MRKVVVCLTVLFFLAIAAVAAAHADTVYDPRIATGDPACQSGDIPLTSNVFNFSAGSGTGLNGNIFNYCNETGHTLFNLDFKVNTFIPAASVSCDGGNVFAHCTPSNPTSSSLDIFFFGGPGVPDHHNHDCDDEEEGEFRFHFVNNFVKDNDDEDEGCGHFFINLNCTTGTACSNWDPGTPFTGVADVPEPVSALLLSTGVLAVIRRRYGKRK
ncbi:MAG TPA: hypothetical protein VK473_06295 [Terriglobales bacterium]|nr:hypothetical protein [Terriglobales bacterium]